MKPHSHGVVSSPHGTTRTRSIRVKSSLGVYPGTSLKVCCFIKSKYDYGLCKYINDLSCVFVLAGLITTFNCFGSLSVEWPGKDGKHPRCPPKGSMPKGNNRGMFFSLLLWLEMVTLAVAWDTGVLSKSSGDGLVLVVLALVSCVVCLIHLRYYKGFKICIKCNKSSLFLFSPVAASYFILHTWNWPERRFNLN